MDNIRELIGERYNINVNKVEKIKNVFCIEGNEDIFCFKKSRYDIGQFEFIMGAILHLIENGFENILPVIKTRDGENYLRINGGYGFLCPWIEAREADYTNPIELKLCVETLGKMHLFSRGYEPFYIPRVRNLLGRWPERFKKRCQDLLYFKTFIEEKKEKTEFDTIYFNFLNSHIEQGIITVNLLYNSNYREYMEKCEDLKEFCHHDTANHNFLITDDLKVFMLDFDYCIRDTRLHDLASIIIRSLRHGNYDMDTMEYIVKIYNRNIPVSKEELYLIFCFMNFPQDFWQIGIQYYVEKQPWTSEVFLKRLNKVVDDVPMRMDFLKELQSLFMEGKIWL